MMDVSTLSTGDLLELIGWSPARFAKQLGGINVRAAQRMASGVNDTPENVRDWLIYLAAPHANMPLPENWKIPCRN